MSGAVIRQRERRKMIKLGAIKLGLIALLGLVGCRGQDAKAAHQTACEQAENLEKVCEYRDTFERIACGGQKESGQD